MELFGLDNHFYHGSIKRYVSLFGSIFSDIHIKRTTDKKEEIISVPIKYGASNMYVKAPNDEMREQTKVAKVLPAMAFELNNLYKDTSRKTNPHNRLQSPEFDAHGKRNYQFNRIPFNLIFDLYIRTKNTDDMLQIVEQIIPAFDGDLSVTIKDSTGVNIEQNIIIRLDELRMEDNYDSEMKNRELEWTLTFEVKGYLYKRTLNDYVVKEANINFSFSEDMVLATETVSDQSPITQTHSILSSLSQTVEEEMPTTPIKKVTRKRANKKE